MQILPTDSIYYGAIRTVLHNSNNIAFIIYQIILFENDCIYVPSVNLLCYNWKSFDYICYASYALYPIAVIPFLTVHIKQLLFKLWLCTVLSSAFLAIGF